MIKYEVVEGDENGVPMCVTYTDQLAYALDLFNFRLRGYTIYKSVVINEVLDFTEEVYSLGGVLVTKRVVPFLKATFNKDNKWEVVRCEDPCNQ